MRKTMSFLSGSMMGALFGAALALLLAPSSGEELRNQMQERAERVQSEVKAAAATRRTELEQQLASLRQPQKPGGV
jgi:gas vesicle protein